MWVKINVSTSKIPFFYENSFLFFQSLRPPPGFGVINLEQTKVKVIQTDSVGYMDFWIFFFESLIQQSIQQILKKK